MVSYTFDKGEFIVTFGGSEPVDIENFNRIKKLLEEGSKAILAKHGDNAALKSVKLKIKATNPGSLEVVFDLTINYIRTIDIGHTISLCSDVCTIVATWLLLKRDFNSSENIEKFDAAAVDYFVKNKNVNDEIVKVYSESDMEYLLLKFNGKKLAEVKKSHKMTENIKWGNYR